MENFEQLNALPVEQFPETVRPLISSIVTTVPGKKTRQHNYKIIERLESELAAIRGNWVYRVLARMNILPRPGR